MAEIENGNIPSMNSFLEASPEFWPLFFIRPEIQDTSDFSYAGYVKKIAPGVLKVTDINEEENIFYDRNGILENALKKDWSQIIRKMITH